MTCFVKFTVLEDHRCAVETVCGLSMGKIQFAVARAHGVNYALCTIPVQEMIEIWREHDEKAAASFLIPSSKLISGVPKYVSIDLDGVIWVYPAADCDIEIDIQFEERDDGRYRRPLTQARGYSYTASHPGAGAGAAPAFGSLTSFVASIAGQAAGGKGSGLTAWQQAIVNMISASPPLAPIVMPRSLPKAWLPPSMPPFSPPVNPGWWHSWGYHIGAFGDPPPKIENAGITVGEIVGWRVWRISRDFFLHSGAMTATVWKPDEPMRGDPEKNSLMYGFTEGVHAFKANDSAQFLEVLNDYRPNGSHDRSFYRAVEEIANSEDISVSKAIALAKSHRSPADFIGLAIGTVSMWGTVIEHQHGYRAEFAQIESVTRVEHLRHGYEAETILGLVRDRYEKPVDDPV